MAGPCPCAWPMWCARTTAGRTRSARAMWVRLMWGGQRTTREAKEIIMETNRTKTVQWLTGLYDGYGIVEHDDGTVDVYGQPPAPAGCLCSCGSWADAEDFMQNDEPTL